MKKSTLLKSSKRIIALKLTFAYLFASGYSFGYNNNIAGNTIATGATLEITDVDCFFGPNSTWNISGELVIYSQNVWIAPTASFTGSGKIIFKDPSERGNAAIANTVDANDGSFIDVNVEQNNRFGIILGNISDPEYGTTNPTGPLAAALKIGKDFLLTAPINGSIALGDVFLNGNNFVFDHDATISGYRIGRFVETGNSISGHIVKTFDASSGPFTFPVGFNSSYPYNPARINASSGTFYVSLQDNATSAADESQLEAGEYITRTWHIYADVPTTATVDLQHEYGNEDGGFDHTAPHIVTRWLGGTAWELNPEGYGTMGVLTTDTPIDIYALRTLTTTVQTLSSPLAYWTKAFLSNPALPVSLIGFNVTKENTALHLEWKTASETNSSNFQIQRSTNAKAWSTIGEVVASVQSNTEKNYSFTDTAPLSGVNYYRLKMIDRDAAFTYSTIRNVLFTESASRTYTYPNPTNGLIRLSDRDLSKIKSVEITNLSGKVLHLFTTVPERGIDVQRFENGHYAMKVSYSDGSSCTHKIVIAK